MLFKLFKDSDKESESSEHACGSGSHTDSKPRGRKRPSSITEGYSPAYGSKREFGIFEALTRVTRRSRRLRKIELKRSKENRKERVGQARLHTKSQEGITSNTRSKTRKRPCSKSSVPQRELIQQEKDIARFTRAVKGNGTDLEAFEAVFKAQDTHLQHPFFKPLLIIAVFGSPEAINYVHTWNTFNWNERIEIQSGVLDGVLDEMKDRQATPLYVATFMKKLPTVKALLKYSAEGNLAYCLNNLPLNNSMESAYIAEVEERLKSDYSALKPVVIPGYMKEVNGNRRRAFVIYSPAVLEAKKYEKKGIGTVMLRNPYKVDSEARTASQNKPGDCHVPIKDMERAKQTIQSHSKKLWNDHSNLNIISVCPVRSKRKGAILERSLCIVLYCSTKGFVPSGEKEFPTQLHLGNNSSIGIDVREGFFEYGAYSSYPSSSRHTKLKMGCNIGRMTAPKNRGGTLGPFVNYNDRMSFLTCAHVLFDTGTHNKVDYTNQIFNRVEVGQPAPSSSYSTGIACGFVQRAILNPELPISVDVAVVAISDSTRKPDKGRFAMDHSYRYMEAGFDELPEYNSGSEVRKISTYATSNMVVHFGSETHLRKGSLIVKFAEVRPLSTAVGKPFHAARACMKGQYQVEGLKSTGTLFNLGDSGSAVFMLKGTSLHCIGMSIGVTAEGNAIVTPIGALLNALGPTCCMTKFEEPSQHTSLRFKKPYRKMDSRRRRLRSLKK